MVRRAERYAKPGADNGRSGFSGSSEAATRLRPLGRLQYFPDHEEAASECCEAHITRKSTARHNDWGKQTYGGPCPSIGRHRYFFKLYALDTQLQGLKNPTKAELEKAMEGHLVGDVELVGTYEKKKK